MKRLPNITRDMPDASHASVLLLAGDGDLPASERVWGTGGWLPPEEREALDWLTLARWMGWGVQTAHVDDPPAMPVGSSDLRCIILGCAPQRLGAEMISWLQSVLIAQPVLVVGRAFAPGSPGAGLAGATAQAERVRGRRFQWLGPGDRDSWTCRSCSESQQLLVGSDAAVWADLDGAPIIAARSVGLGTIATLGFHPSYARDASGAATALLRHLLTRGAHGPVAWLDFQDSLVLRMDDPGGAQNIYCASWCYRKLGEWEWREIAAGLRRHNARLSIGYVGGWADDGDVRRGELRVAGRAVPRVAGRVYPSPIVQYSDQKGHAPGTFHDYGSEFRGIQNVRAQGAGDVELHGYTHVHPDVHAWSKASDRYSSVAWYREFGASASKILAAQQLEEHPLAKGIGVLSRHFGVRPTTLICPGDEWTNETMSRALDLRLDLVSSYYLAIRHEQRFCWTTHVCAPYLDQPDAAWFDSGLPVVGYFHDREPALEGPQWVDKWLGRWHDAGARRFLDFRELAAAVGYRLRLDARHHLLHVQRADEATPVPVRPIPLLIRATTEKPPAQITCIENRRSWPLPVESLENGLWRAFLMPPPSRGD